MKFYDIFIKNELVLLRDSEIRMPGRSVFYVPAALKKRTLRH